MRHCRFSTLGIITQLYTLQLKQSNGHRWGKLQLKIHGGKLQLKIHDNIINETIQNCADFDIYFSVCRVLLEPTFEILTK